MDDRIEDMIRDIEIESFVKSHMYENMSSNGETSLYPRSTNFTRSLTI